MEEIDIKNFREDKIVNIKDFVQYWSKHYYGFEYAWKGEYANEERLVVWLNFRALPSLTKLFSQSTIEENEEDFECILRKDCLVFPHFEYILNHTDIDEEDIEELFPKE